MRAVLIFLALPLLAAAPATVQPHKPATTAPAKAEGPKSIGTFEDWTAATNTEAGQTICYAFVRAGHSTPATLKRGEALLTVTQRPGGRDAVAITAGFTLPANAVVAVTVGTTALEFAAPSLTARSSAYARDGHAAAVAFGHGTQVTARLPASKNAAVVDTFSLKGFTRAYEAINKACPPK
jgi:hypothetical protein